MLGKVLKNFDIRTFWRDVRFLKWAGQVLFLILFAYSLLLFVQTGINNLQSTNIPFSFDFLGDTPGVSIAEGFETLPDSGLRMLHVGMFNMIRIMIGGIIVATIFGTLLGIARLSSNWIVEKAATSLLEVVRNVPLLVQILFFQAFLLSFPRLEERDRGEVMFHVSSKGIAYPWPERQESAFMFFGFLLLTIYLARRVFKWRVSLLEKEGRDTNPFLWSFLTFLVLTFGNWTGGYKLMGIIGLISGYISAMFDSIPSIAYQVLFSVIAVFFAFRYIRKQIRNTDTGEIRGILSDDDYFRIILSGVVAVFVVLLMFMPFGQNLTYFLEGDELFYKSNWGMPQFFDGVAKRFDFNISGPPVIMSYPEIIQAGTTKFTRYSPDLGKVTTVGYFATWFGVTLYTAIFISEVVRSGIMAISKGQSEAGLSLGLRRRSLLRLIILPQAFRVMLPPMGNQYLNLAKNTSLGVAVAYPEVVAVGQTLYNQEGQTLPVFLVWMIFYCSISLSISSIINYYNRKMKIVER